METLTIDQLADKLRAVDHAQPIGFSALTDARPKQTGNPYEGIYKLSKVSAFAGIDYANSVNLQREREYSEPDFEAQHRAWGHHISVALIEHNGQLYLCVKVERARKPVYMVKQTGRGLYVVDKSKVAEWLPAYRRAQSQGTEKEIVYRNYRLDSIVSLRMGGKSYRVRRS